MCWNWSSTIRTMSTGCAASLQDAAGPDLILSDWRQRNATFYNTLKVERNVMFVIVMLIVLVATLNIISGLTMLVKNKGRDIAVLRTMGATRGAIMRVFFISGTSIGFIGTLAGLILGVLVSLHLEDIRQVMSFLTNTRLFDPQVYFLSSLPSQMDPLEVAAVVILARAVHGGHALPGAAGGAPRPGGSVALRVTPEHLWRRHDQDNARFCRDRPVLQLVGLERTYYQGDRALEVLRGACAEIYEGEAVALVGPSGSGKSSLLHMTGLLEKPGGGSVFLNGIDCTALSDKDRTRVRRTEIGFVYQFHNLLPEFSALENVMMPQLVAGIRKKDAKARAMELLASFGLEERATHRPAELSGGEQQRVAIARARCERPERPFGGRADGQPRPSYRRPRVRGADLLRPQFRRRRSDRHP